LCKDLLMTLLWGPQSMKYCFTSGLKFDHF
jgi:hypothetical protein